jgi:hypothetical protein
MMASRFTKAFQLIALALVFAVTQVYVMAAPTRANSGPGTTPKAPATQPKAEPVAADSSESKITSKTTLPVGTELLTTEAAAERMPLTAGTSTALNRIFSKKDMETRIAAGNTFLTAKTSFADTFKSPVKRTASSSYAQTDSDGDDDDDDGARSTWIAVGVIAAVLTIAVIGLRRDRNENDD